MRPVPSSILLVLLLGLWGLCGWQWHRETLLRGINQQQSADLAKLKSERDDFDLKLKAADAEILRLTGSVNELRTNSVAKTQFEELAQTNTMLREKIEKQNALVLQQNEAVEKQNAAITQANQNIRTLIDNRDELAKRLNDVTAQYNKLAKAGGSSSPPVSGQ